MKILKAMFETSTGYITIEESKRDRNIAKFLGQKNTAKQKDEV